MAEVEISAMTFGPYGVGRIDGKTVMVPNAAPGDQLEVELSRAHRDYAIGRIARILRGGPDRREPPCPFLPRCGGGGWRERPHFAPGGGEERRGPRRVGAAPPIAR